MKILVVEDDPKIASFLKKGLEEESFCVDVCNSGEDALYLVGVNLYDIIILDIMLHGMNGDEACRRIRHEKITTPILMLTAKNAIDDKVTLLNAGADDYLTKPFSFEELLARIRVQLRKKEQVDNILYCADLAINLNTKEVNRGGISIPLTSKEYAILEYLARNQGILVDESRLLETIFSFEKTINSNILNVYMYRLRSKIDKPYALKLIKTHRNQGFILSDTSR